MLKIKLKGQAKEAIRGNLWSIMTILIMVCVAQIVLSYVTSWAGGVGSLLITGSCSLAMAMIFLRLISKHQKPQIEDILLGF
jgi:uncharacterized membrane protein